MAATLRWLEPPRLRSPDDEDDRRATWLELFFDLVFVVAVGQVALNLTDDPTLGGFAEFAAVFVPVWWAWVGFTFYADRFDTDDPLYRGLMLTGMLMVAALAVNVHGALDGGSTEFALSYVAVRTVLVLLYLRAGRHVPEARGLITVYAAAFTAGATCFLASLLLPEPQRYILWAVGLVIDMGTPLVARRLIAQAPIHASHIPERIGLFTIIVLGESVIAVVAGTTSTSWELRAVVPAAGGFAAAACIWWIYFDYLDTSVVTRSIAAGQIYLYGHLPLLIGLTAAGAGTKLAIKDAARHELSAGAQWAICGGIALTLVSMSAIHLTTTRSLHDHDLWLRVGAAGIAVGLAFLDTSALVVVPLLVAALVALVAVEIAGHEGHRLVEEESLADSPPLEQEPAEI